MLGSKKQNNNFFSWHCYRLPFLFEVGYETYYPSGYTDLKVSLGDLG
jgi:hypothetical protein